MNIQLLGFFTPLIIYAVITLFHCIFSGRKVKGYVRNDQNGEALYYRLNGLLVLITCVLLWVLLGLFDLLPVDYLYQVRWESLAGALVIGLLFSLFMVLPHKTTGKNFFADLWFGRLKNPQFKNGYIDAKLWLYLVGAIMLQLNILSFAAHHLQTFKDVNPGFILGAALLTWFILDYLAFENIHLYTYDFIAERVGFKLSFGCLAFYPYFYAIALWVTADLPNPQHPLWLTVCFAIIFIVGWSLARGANLQKFYFKISPHKKFLGKKPETLSDGQHSLLVGGFWGRSRHINYLGEILMACGIVLAVGYPATWQVWLYPLYYICFLVVRQINDNKICKAKYGALWDEYTKKVKYRIIPYIY
jgi:delta14-sterol reductase